MVEKSVGIQPAFAARRKPFPIFPAPRCELVIGPAGTSENSAAFQRREKFRIEKSRRDG